MRVKLIKNPVGKYNLSYEIGEEINLPDAQAMDMIEDGYAIPLADKPQNASDKRTKVESR